MKIFRLPSSHFYQDTRHLQFHRVGKNVEFALHPQHETSCDSEIQIKEDFNYFKNKSRKRPRSLSMFSLNSNDWEEYWNTKVTRQDGLNSERTKLEQSDD